MADGMGAPFTLTEVRHAIIVPPPPRLPTRRKLPLAVLNAAGDIVPGTDCATNRLSSHGFMPSPDQLTNPETLPGTWLYGGLASHHFGHQMTRSLGRLQGLALAGKIDGIVFAPLDARARSDASQKLMTRLFTGLGITAPLHQITATTRVERLLVGPDLFSEQTECVADPRYISWARTAFRPKTKPVPGSKLFVTRTQLDPALGRLLCEDVLEQNLARAGYQVYAPEIHSLADQMDTYASAQTIITTDGSHGHVMAFARQPGQNIITIARRFEAPELLLNHLNCFGAGLEASSHTYLTCLTREWWPRKRADNLSLGEADFAVLFEELLRCGAVSLAAKAGWKIPDHAQIDASKSRGMVGDDSLLSSDDRVAFLFDLRQARKQKAAKADRAQAAALSPPQPITKPLQEAQQTMDTKVDPELDTIDPAMRPQGLRYFRFLKALHQRVRPDWYLEIGTFTGSSLRFADCNFVAIDPAFQLHQIPPMKGREMVFFQDTSDAFFKSGAARRLKGKINLAFLDGLHHYEALLRDFTNIEPLMADGGMVVIHDCLPSTVAMTSRIQTPETEWAGDVWKTLMILLEERPDLQIDVLDAAPTGMVAIRKFDAAGNKKLKSRYKSLIKTWDPITMDTYPGGLSGFWDKLAVRPAGPFLDTLTQR